LSNPFEELSWQYAAISESSNTHFSGLIINGNFNGPTETLLPVGFCWSFCRTNPELTIGTCSSWLFKRLSLAHCAASRWGLTVTFLPEITDLSNPFEELSWELTCFSIRTSFSTSSSKPRISFRMQETTFIISSISDWQTFFILRVSIRFSTTALNWSSSGYLPQFTPACISLNSLLE